MKENQIVLNQNAQYSGKGVHLVKTIAQVLLKHSFSIIFSTFDLRSAIATYKEMKNDDQPIDITLVLDLQELACLDNIVLSTFDSKVRLLSSFRNLCFITEQTFSIGLQRGE